MAVDELGAHADDLLVRLADIISCLKTAAQLSAAAYAAGVKSAAHATSSVSNAPHGQPARAVHCGLRKWFPALTTA